MITTTLHHIRSQGPCAQGWRTLLAGMARLGWRGEPHDDAVVSYADLFLSNGLEDMAWALRAEEGHAELYARICCALARMMLPFTDNAELHATMAKLTAYKAYPGELYEFAAEQAKCNSLAGELARDEKYAESAIAWAVSWAVEALVTPHTAGTNVFTLVREHFDFRCHMDRGDNDPDLGEYKLAQVILSALGYPEMPSRNVTCLLQKTVELPWEEGDDECETETEDVSSHEYDPEELEQLIKRKLLRNRSCEPCDGNTRIFLSSDPELDPMTDNTSYETLSFVSGNANTWRTALTTAYPFNRRTY